MMMNIWGMTDIGLVRRENQDAYAVQICGETGFTVCVVCDGMGGPGGGKMASRLAVDAFMSTCQGNLQKDMTWDQVRDVTAFAVAAANTAVYERSRGPGGMRGMGTTLVSAVLRRGEALVDNVGDSRAYVVRKGGGTVCVTRDHSVVARLVEQGNITAEEARRHPNRNLITRALGPDQEAFSDHYMVSLGQGDCMLLCTDGLTGTVTDQELEQEILRGTDDNRCLDRLLELAKAQGAPDNVTAVLLQRQ